MRLFRIFLVFILAAFAEDIFSNNQVGDSTLGSSGIHLYLDDPWVDSVFNSLSQEERIAQLLVIRTYSNKKQSYYDSISRVIQKYNIGGLTFFQGTPAKQAKLTNYWQSIAKTPLLITIDAEWGLGMRLDGAYSFPKQMTLGALPGSALVEEMGRQIGIQCKRLGIQMNFAPVVDINNNPKNPVINYRSFGENPQNVASKSAAYILGMQSIGTIATAKHFPGHGDTDTDSHKTLPLLNHSIEQIDTVDLVPFRSAIDAGTGGVMIAHLFVPAIDDKKDIATSLSAKAVNEILRKDLQFTGLSVTDALDMKGVTNYHKPGKIELMAFMAGNDILLLPLDVPKAIKSIKKAIKRGKINMEDVNSRCRKILTFKRASGLDKITDIEMDGLHEDLNSRENILLTERIFKDAVTLLKNQDQIIPLTHLDTLKIATLVIGSKEKSDFQATLDLYDNLDHFNLKSKYSKKELSEILRKLKAYNLVILGLQNTNNSVSRNYGISEEISGLIEKLGTLPGRLIVDLFGNPYALSVLNTTDNIDALLVSYEDKPAAEKASAGIIFGASAAKGTLPVTTGMFSSGAGIATSPVNRLSYTIPEDLGIPAEKLLRIDSLIQVGIDTMAYPGCQVLFAKDGKVFYNKTFGHHTYAKTNKVSGSDLYDLASLTKVLSSTLLTMQLSEQGRLDVDMPLSFYMPELKNTNKENLVIADILTHQSGLQAWIPYYRKTIEDFYPSKDIYSPDKRRNFSIQVADKMYMRNNYVDEIFDTIFTSELLEPKRYKYSDIGYYMLWKTFEDLTKIPFENYMDSHFYQPLGLSTMCFKPLDRFKPEGIVPTEVDTIFRKQLVHGYVHDPGAAMLGGVCAHAGLFSNANDIAITLQMLLQGGSYGGVQYLSPETISFFTKQQFPLDENRRGLGFDKPLPEFDPDGPVCESASHDSYGHSGFTGTYFWVDPENQLVYVFLSNRIHPYADNRLILKMDLRTRVHQMMYDILNETNQ